MHPLDVDEIRAMDIKLHGLTRADESYTFYHDETNNIHKLRVNADGFNMAALKVFVLGGVAHKGAPRPIDLTTLRSQLRIQASAQEIKLKHIAQGAFLDVLASEKLRTFLQWLAAGDFYVQYAEIDPLFWGSVDIVDSILAERRDLAQARFYHLQIKSDLVALLRADQAATARLFHDHGYPSLAAHERKPFIADLLTLIEREQDVIDPFSFMMLKGVIQAGRTVAELPFIEGNLRHVLIEEFATFYRTRIILFKNATHIFDDESSVKDNLQAVPLVSQGAPFVNYRFADSKLEPGVQISDIVVGLLGKMHSYFCETSADAVFATRSALTGVRLDNALLLRDLIAASDAENIAFQHHAASHHDRDKADRFLRFADGAYAG